MATILLALNDIPDGIAKPPPLEVLRRFHRYIDLVGFFLSACALTSLLLGLELGSKAGSEGGWNQPFVIALLTTAGITGVGFCAWSVYKGEDALFPASVVRLRRIWSAALTTAFAYASMAAIQYYLPLFFQGVRGDSAKQNALWTMPATPAFVVVIVAYSILRKSCPWVFISHK